VHAFYEALSYFWGSWISIDKPQLQQLEKDGHTGAVHVSLSLWNALLHLRDNTLKCTLWADQLCINRRDKTEVSRQVSIVDKIYSRAQNVIIWLGAGDSVIEQAIDTINEILPRFQDPSKELMEQNNFRGVLPNTEDDSLL
jgi:hypothetical protein